MPRQANTFNFGSSTTSGDPLLARQLSQAYSQTMEIVNTKISKWIVSTGNPPANDPANANFDIGDIYIRTDTGAKFIMTQRTTSNAVTWTAF